MHKLLITGGPVFAYLDAVKILTNKFKGGLMAELADDFVRKFPVEVTYLTNKGSTLPKCDNVKVIYHDGFDDYREKVTTLAKDFDSMILGAAVANLIPCNPWKGKFPSHDYKVGDVIPIDFTIAPRVICEVKKNAPNVNLFGFKLLAGVDHEELVRAAYEIILDAGANAVIANDAKKLDDKFLVMKDRSVHPQDRLTLADALWPMMHDQFYSSVLSEQTSPIDAKVAEIQTLITTYSGKGWFEPTVEGLVFGTFAVRDGNGFVTTARGKKELEQFVRVVKVDHESLKVFVEGDARATLNAPLLARIFESNPEVHSVVHMHHNLNETEHMNLPVSAYAPPGTVRDNLRFVGSSFVIERHGSFLLLDKEGRIL